MPSIKEIIQKHPSWDCVKAIQSELTIRGFQVFLVGGCVRDFLMGFQSSDLDMATNATPEQIEKLFPKTLMIGKNFGVSVILMKNTRIELATFRDEADYKDGRHPSTVVYGTIEQDALRRDFTVNALYYDLVNDHIIDLVGGQLDLQKKTLRCVGDPVRRFNEDHLRMMRAVRFSAQLDFEIEPKTWKAITDHHEKIDKISKERIRDELLKFLKFAHVKHLIDFSNSQLLISIFPEWTQDLNFCKKIWSRLFPILDSIKISDLDNKIHLNSALLILFLLPISFQKVNIKLYTGRLKLPHQIQEDVEHCLQFVQNRSDLTKKRMGQLIQEVDRYPASLLNKIFETLDDHESFIKINNILTARQSVLIDGALPKALITGAEANQYFSGRELGVFLRECYWSQLEKEFSLKEEADRWLQSKIKIKKATI